jgi:hypothetical protein
MRIGSPPTGGALAPRILAGAIYMLAVICPATVEGDRFVKAVAYLVAGVIAVVSLTVVARSAE